MSRPAGGEVTLRAPAAGDLGWVVHRQALLYAREYGFNWEFEGMIADIVARFVAGYDARWDHCWIAEHGGRVMGSIFLVRSSDEVAKLRLLYVEAEARGLGIGKTLVETCVDFARAAGYRRILLGTHGMLIAARALYQRAGFVLVSETHESLFGQELISEDWALDLYT